MEKKLFLFILFILNCSSFESKNYIVSSPKINASSLKEIYIIQSVFSNTIFPETNSVEEKYFIERIKEKLQNHKQTKEEKLISYHYTTRIKLEKHFGIQIKKFLNLKDSLKETKFKLYPHLNDSVSLFYPELILNYENFKIDNPPANFETSLSELVKKLNLEGILFELHFFEITKLNPIDESFEISFKSYRSIITDKEVHTSIGLVTPNKKINLQDIEIFNLFETSAYLSIDQLIQNFGTNSADFSEQTQK